MPTQLGINHPRCRRVNPNVMVSAELLFMGQGSDFHWSDARRTRRKMRCCMCVQGKAK
eukprot:COSAG01_NODE_208_length_21996_cov_31.972097_4_plen_58_part_00